VLAVDDNRPAVGPEQAQDQLEDDRLPVPLAPSSTFMLPLAIVKLTSRSTT
jgi:hypothetical protein